MKTSLPNIAAACLGLAAGAMLVLASRESQTQASHEPPAITIPDATPVIVTPVEPERETVPPPLAPSVDAHDVVALVPASGDCANGVCAPRAAVVAKRATTQRYQPQTRRGLFGRFRR